MIENYIDLINAIYNSDEIEKSVRSVICVYDTLADEKLIGTFNKSKMCGKFFKTSSAAIDVCVSKGSLKFGRYRLERVELD